MKRYTYFFYYEDREAGCQGNGIIFSDEPIKTLEQLNKLQEELNRRYNQKASLIENLQLLCVEEVEETES